jgi:uncharacterized RDD family membrane protein YckC
MKDIDKGIRITNYIIDILAIFILCLIITIVFSNSNSKSLTFYLVMFFYYLLLEGITGQTLGKMITKTKVVLKDGSKPNFLRILMRSVCRLIPIDAFSYLFGSGLGIHDSLSSTKLSKKDS